MIRTDESLARLFNTYGTIASSLTFEFRLELIKNVGLDTRQIQVTCHFIVMTWQESDSLSEN